jgi:hypothetical protein
LLWVGYFRNNSSEDYVGRRVVKAGVPGVELSKRDNSLSHTHNSTEDFQPDRQIPQPEFASDEPEQAVESDRSADETNESHQAQIQASTLLSNVSTHVSLKDLPIAEIEQSIEEMVESDRYSNVVQELDVNSDSDSEVEETQAESEVEAQDTDFYDEFVAVQRQSPGSDGDSDLGEPDIS